MRLCFKRAEGLKIMWIESTARPSISVLMPVYNSRDYIQAAVETILNQDFQSFELLLIDDGSTDGSAEVCDGLAKGDKRIVAIHKENGGQCDARNVGIEAANGDYIAFCDNDDECLPGFLSDNYSVAVRDNADCVRFGRTLMRIAEDGSVLRKTVDVPPAQVVFDLDKLTVQKDFYKYYFFGSNGVWNGLYKRKMLLENEIRFDVRLRHGFEDTLFNDCVYLASRRTSFNDRSYYIWKRRTAHSSSMVSGADDRFLGLELVLEKESELFERVKLYKIDAPFVVNRLMLHAKDLLTMDFYALAKPSFKKEAEVYERLRAVYEPYFDKLSGIRAEFQYSFIRDCLKDRRYKLLYLFIKAGVSYKSLSR